MQTPFNKLCSFFSKQYNICLKTIIGFITFFTFVFCAILFILKINLVFTFFASLFSISSVFTYHIMKLVCFGEIMVNIPFSQVIEAYKSGNFYNVMVSYKTLIQSETLFGYRLYNYYLASVFSLGLVAYLYKVDLELGNGHLFKLIGNYLNNNSRYDLEKYITSEETLNSPEYIEKVAKFREALLKSTNYKEPYYENLISHPIVNKNKNGLNALELINPTKDCYDNYDVKFFALYKRKPIEEILQNRVNNAELFNEFFQKERVVSICDSQTDIISSSNYGYNGAWDFICPTTLEFRGIVELYGFVMYILFAIFLVLFTLSMVGLHKWGYFKLLKKWIKKSSPGEFLGRLCVWLKKYLLMVIISIRIYIDTVLNLKKYNSMLKKGEEQFLVDWKSALLRLKKNIENINVGRYLLLKNYHKVNLNSLTLLRKTISGSNTIKFIVTNEPQVYWVHFSKLEFVWTLIPCIILLFISVPSFTLALSLDEVHRPISWVKIIGSQWYWTYESGVYSTQIIISSNIVPGSDLNLSASRLYEVDNYITIKENEHTRLLITSTDVIHSWTVPTMGVKVDACPGRINAVTILPTRSGIFYGQCSELCGVNHAFMPICVEVIK